MIEDRFTDRGRARERERDESQQGKEGEWLDCSTYARNQVERERALKESEFDVWMTKMELHCT